MSEKGKTLVERHALKRLAKVEKNKQKAYEKKAKRNSLENNHYGGMFYNYFGNDFIADFC